MRLRISPAAARDKNPWQPSVKILSFGDAARLAKSRKANPSIPNVAKSDSKLNSFSSGFIIIKTPMKPRPIANHLITPTLSLKKIEAPMTTTSGVACKIIVVEDKEVKESAMQVEEIDDVDLQLVWDPPWTKDMMSDAAKLELNL